jgi:hypothetical protein
MRMSWGGAVDVGGGGGGVSVGNSEVGVAGSRVAVGGSGVAVDGSVGVGARTNEQANDNIMSSTSENDNNALLLVILAPFYNCDPWAKLLSSQRFIALQSIPAQWPRRFRSGA